MPIKPENKQRYPKNWKTVIRPTILERAEHACEGSPDYPNCRALNYEAHPETGSKVVLTIAHLDHTPENNDPDNLRAWCQRCHLNYDKEHHAKNSAKTRRDKSPVSDMFDYRRGEMDEECFEVLTKLREAASQILRGEADKITITVDDKEFIERGRDARYIAKGILVACKAFESITL